MSKTMLQLFVTRKEARLIADGTSCQDPETRGLAMRVYRALIEDEDHLDKKNAVREVQTIATRTYPKKERET